MTLIGYLAAWSFAPGDRIELRLSDSAAPRQATAELVRIAGMSADGRTPRCVRVTDGPPSTFATTRNTTVPGAYGRTAGGLGDRASSGIGLAVLVKPTVLRGAVQYLLSVAGDDGGNGVALALDETNRPVLLVGDGSAQHRLTAASSLPIGAWSWVVAGYDADDNAGTVAAGVFGGSDVEIVRQPVPPPRVGDTRPIVVGAGLLSAGRVVHPFTGCLEEPVVLDRPPEPDALRAWAASDQRPVMLPGEQLAAWDFRAGGASFTVADASEHGRDLMLENLPLRAVTGARWRPGSSSWTAAPDEYAAIHFAADSLADAGWPVAVSLVVPADARSGCYAVRVRCGADSDLVPFFVRPVRPSADVLFVASTATYLAYSNSRCWWERPDHEVQCDAVVQLGREEQIVLAAPELGLSAYDLHADGEPVRLVSMRRPNLDMRPGHRRQEGYTSDLLVAAWFEREAMDYDVITDHDLDARGADALRSYRVVVLGTHPEYVSSRMWHAVDDYVGAGGRVIVMGGNALHWRVAFHPDRPWVMEVRKPELGHGSLQTRTAERVLAFTGEPGGMTEDTELAPGDLSGSARRRWASTWAVRSYARRRAIAPDWTSCSPASTETCSVAGRTAASPSRSGTTHTAAASTPRAPSSSPARNGTPRRPGGSAPSAAPGTPSWRSPCAWGAALSSRSPRWAGRWDWPITTGRTTRRVSPATSCAACSTRPRSTSRLDAARSSGGEQSSQVGTSDQLPLIRGDRGVADESDGGQRVVGREPGPKQHALGSEQLADLLQSAIGVERAGVAVQAGEPVEAGEQAALVRVTHVEQHERQTGERPAYFVDLGPRHLRQFDDQRNAPCLETLADGPDDVGQERVLPGVDGLVHDVVRRVRVQSDRRGSLGEQLVDLVEARAAALGRVGREHGAGGVQLRMRARVSCRASAFPSR